MDRAAITPALASELVAAQFPHWAHLPVTPVECDGWDNTTFRLGDEMSVRLPSAAEYVAQVDKEHRWLPVLAGHVPVAIPEPLAKGTPGSGYPWPWSVYRWLPGEPATEERIADLRAFAIQLAEVLTALHTVAAAGGPVPGSHNFFRGGPVGTYDAQTRTAIAALEDDVDAVAATRVWEAALLASWHGPPVWVHGDVAAGNLLVEDGTLSAIIDFGCAAVGDPACDVAIAWTLFSGDSREAFRTRLDVDERTWARGRGWALWKALITIADPASAGASDARRVIAAVLAEDQVAE